MAHATHRPRRTVEDYLALPDDVRAELIQGELYVTPSPRRRHQEAIENLFTLLGAHVRRAGLGHLHLSPLDVHLPSGDVVQPDLIFVAAANDVIRQDWIRGVPDLLIEVVSPDNPERDRIVKRDVYASNGVREYWLVDPASCCIEVFRLEAGTYRAAGWFRAGSTLLSPSLPDLALPVDEIFPD